MVMVNIFTASNFDSEVLKSDIPVLVDFYADWCGPCKVMAPVVDKLAERYAGRLKVGKCNIDDETDIAQRFRVMSIPSFIIFKGQEAVSVSMGVMAESDLDNKIQQALQ